jgi:hypothetical protein
MGLLLDDGLIVFILSCKTTKEYAQLRFNLLWQLRDTVLIMFLCKTPSDKTFELH